MAIEAKVEFMQTLEKNLANRITVTDMGTLLAAVSDDCGRIREDGRLPDDGGGRG